MLSVCNMYYDNRDAMRRLIGEHSHNESFINAFVQTKLTVRPDSPYKTHFLAGGVSFLLTDWLRGGCKEKPEFIANMLADYITRLT